MARAICDNCEKEVFVTLRRGMKLKDSRCFTCGGPLHGKTRGLQSANKDKKGQRCSVCKRLRFTPLRGFAFRPSVHFPDSLQPIRLSHRATPLDQITFRGRYGPGDFTGRCCYWHDIFIPDPRYHNFTRDELRPREENCLLCSQPEAAHQWPDILRQIDEAMEAARG